ncbi:hypothetical protein [Agrobacterium tumefaciens]|uniref:hypothetical protein n=1 Tax=Agrobacterium tumefaciens TaxID=358 RepID=UPI0021CE67AA|nr:hypothetical protein [Agrobacterium tumefaciens]UXS26945.1 hypothetical protein FY153_21020 [Agrobacterium tumefaciens]UXS54556.1 hypothetical protein FY148_17750 [Agrobacterium tumefaciens]UXS65471.1 hypothetical protein FY147_21445 [Agrobacterium tumefaciens]
MHTYLRLILLAFTIFIGFATWANESGNLVGHWKSPTPNGTGEIKMEFNQSGMVNILLSSGNQENIKWQRLNDTAPAGYQAIIELAPLDGKPNQKSKCAYKIESGALSFGNCFLEGVTFTRVSP